jgi:LytS/YehU family sensor histidine kinase
VPDAACGRALRLEITNRSSGALAAQSGDARIGLGNTRARLQAIYGAEARLELERPDAQSFRATLYLPLSQDPRAGSS